MSHLQSNLRVLFWPAALAAAALLGSALAQTPAGPAAGGGTVTGFSAFEFIGNLNIFNPTRVGWVPGGAQPHAETISFVGTLESAKGRLAFFDGSDPGYRKALGPGEAIAGIAVARIEADSVVLTLDSKPVTLAMGGQLRRPPGGKWQPGGPLPGEAPAAGAATAAPAAPAVPADASDVLKRLMEQRQKQLKQ